MKVTVELTDSEYEQLSTLADNAQVDAVEYAAHRLRMHLQAQEDTGSVDDFPEGTALSGIEYAADSVELPNLYMSG